MCFDWQSSLVAWVISVGIAAYLYHRNQPQDRWYALFIATFSLVQLFEGGIWLGMGETNNYNGLFTTLILIGLCLQPMIQTFGAYAYSEGPTPYTTNTYIGFMTLIGVVFLIQAIKYSEETHESTIGEKGHLVWIPDKVFNSNLITGLYLMGLFVPLVLVPTTKNITLLIIGVMTLLYSMYTTSGKEFGSYWCFTAIAYSIGALIL